VLVDGAEVCAEVLADLRSVLAAEDGQSLTLAQAAARSGYSEDHLGRLVRSGRLPNLGRKGSPRIRAGDLPRRIAAGRGNPYDARTDARDLLTEKD